MGRHRDEVRTGEREKSELCGGDTLVLRLVGPEVRLIRVRKIKEILKIFMCIDVAGWIWHIVA
jgi:hypothetical protein